MNKRKYAVDVTTTNVPCTTPTPPAPPPTDAPDPRPVVVGHHHPPPWAGPAFNPAAPATRIKGNSGTADTQEGKPYSSSSMQEAQMVEDGAAPPPPPPPSALAPPPAGGACCRHRHCDRRKANARGADPLQLSCNRRGAAGVESSGGRENEEENEERSEEGPSRSHKRNTETRQARTHDYSTAERLCSVRTDAQRNRISSCWR